MKENETSELTLVKLVYLMLQLESLVTTTDLPVQNRAKIYCQFYFIHHCYRKLSGVFFNQIPHIVPCCLKSTA